MVNIKKSENVINAEGLSCGRLFYINYGCSGFLLNTFLEAGC